jgi:hypothetical protein
MRRFMTTARAFFTGVTVLLLIGRADVASAQCTMDIQCKGDRVCRDGVCADPSPAQASTAGDAPMDRAMGQQTDVLTPMEPRSPAMQTTGIVLTALGAATLVATVVLAVDGAFIESSAGAQCPNHICPATSDISRFNQGRDFEAAAVWTGLATLPLLGAGIPLWVVGGHKVAAPRSAWWMPREVRAGLQRVSVTFEF